MLDHLSHLLQFLRWSLVHRLLLLDSLSRLLVLLKRLMYFLHLLLPHFLLTSLTVFLHFF